MITGKINLRQLKHALMTTPKGAKCIMIPIVENELFEGEKGIYLDIVGFELKTPSDKSKDTHIVKQSFTKERLEKMTDAEKKELPIIGNFRVMTGADSHSEPAPKGSDKVADGLDDLPF
jgi:hypothetical protein